jgi:hypothetical protein
MANVVVSGLATWNGKALKKAKQDVAVFDKQVKKLARTFGLTFSAAALVSFSKKAIKAFTDDEAAAKRLQLQLENTGNAFRVSEVEAYIKSLEKTVHPFWGAARLATCESFARRNPFPEDKKETASKILVLPAPFSPVSTTGR